LERAKAFMAVDDDRILPEAHTALYSRGEKTALSVVLFHGITNNPAQYSELAPLVHERGVNVFVPRMPFHGFRDRLTPDIAALTAEELLIAATEAVDIAAGLGERVALLGISMGASLSAYFAQHRQLAVAVPVAPDFSLLQLPYPVSKLFARIFLMLPNFWFWWDPRAKAQQKPHTAYPRCSTRALMQTLRVGDDVVTRSQHERPATKSIVTVVNRADPAVNNEVTQQVWQAWSDWNGEEARYVDLRNLPENHDIIDPRNPLARTAIVYPKLIEALGLQI
jgi:alpha-beta hydrolase superfamily lysophospholipase